MDKRIRHIFNRHLHPNSTSLRGHQQDNTSSPSRVSSPSLPAKFQLHQCSTPPNKCMPLNSPPLTQDSHLSPFRRATRLMAQAIHNSNSNSQSSSINSLFPNNSSTTKWFLKSPFPLVMDTPQLLTNSNHQYREKLSMFFLLIGPQEITMSVL